MIEAVKEESGVREWLDENAEGAILFDGFEEAIIGVAQRFGSHQPIIAYDLGKVFDILISQGMTREEAEEHFQFNVIGGWYGPGTPTFIQRIP